MAGCAVASRRCPGESGGIAVRGAPENPLRNSVRKFGGRSRGRSVFPGAPLAATRLFSPRPGGRCGRSGRFSAARGAALCGPRHRRSRRPIPWKHRSRVQARCGARADYPKGRADRFPSKPLPGSGSIGRRSGIDEPHRENVFPEAVRVFKCTQGDDLQWGPTIPDLFPPARNSAPIPPENRPSPGKAGPFRTISDTGPPPRPAPRRLPPLTWGGSRFRPAAAAAREITGSAGTDDIAIPAHRWRGPDEEARARSARGRNHRHSAAPRGGCFKAAPGRLSRLPAAAPRAHPSGPRRRVPVHRPRPTRVDLRGLLFPALSVHPVLDRHAGGPGRHHP